MFSLFTILHGDNSTYKCTYLLQKNRHSVNKKNLIMSPVFNTK